MYCFAPTSFNGSVAIYNKVIRPFILKHQKKIDETVNKAAGLAQTIHEEGIIKSELVSNLYSAEHWKCKELIIEM